MIKFIFLFLTVILSAQNAFNTMQYNPPIRISSVAFAKIPEEIKMEEEVTPDILIEDNTTPITEEILLPTDRNNLELPLSSPVNQYRITSQYGIRYHPIAGQMKMHYGIDLVPVSNEVKSIDYGIVVKADYDTKCGIYIKINHGRMESLYCHLSNIYVIQGTKVKPGDIIGMVGATGSATGKHLHFALKKDGKYINPIYYLNTLNEIP